jgi:hypothetical protein
MGRGSWSAAFRRPQFKQANTVIASPASKSTARSGNIAPWHLSHVFMDRTLTLLPDGAYPPEVLDHEGNKFPICLLQLVRLDRRFLNIYRR